MLSARTTENDHLRRLSVAMTVGKSIMFEGVTDLRMIQNSLSSLLEVGRPSLDKSEEQRLLRNELNVGGYDAAAYSGSGLSANGASAFYDDRLQENPLFGFGVSTSSGSDSVEN